VTDLETCLFTGEALTDATPIEHCIPRQLAGRIKSRCVSSAAFNNATSEIDDLFCTYYKPLLNALAPLLSREHCQAALRGHDETGASSALAPGGVPVPGVRIVRDQNGRVSSAFIPEGADPRQVLPGLSLDPTRATQGLVVATGGQFHINRSVFGSPKTEVAALKSILLSFDAVLGDQPERRFTRQEGLREVREFVRRSVMTGSIRPEDHYRFVMGFQYRKLPDLQVLRSQLTPTTRGRFAFEHVLFASGNTASRTVDAVWLVAGFDPVGFRLSSTWREQDFTCVIASGMLRGQHVSRPIWRDRAEYFCERSPYRCGGLSAEADGRAVLLELAKIRHEACLRAYREAVLLVETTCDPYVCERLAEVARMAAIRGDADVTPGDVVERRLRSLYGARLEAAAAGSAFDERLSRAFAAAEARLPELRCPGAGRTAEWTEYLPLYRDSLSRLASSALGAPGNYSALDHQFNRLPAEE
jgi:hypothetical protein